MASSFWEKIETAARPTRVAQEQPGVGMELGYLYRDDLAYGQLADEIANGELEDDEHFNRAPLDGWLSDI
jgi:hypothetical protein